MFFAALIWCSQTFLVEVTLSLNSHAQWLILALRKRGPCSWALCLLSPRAGNVSLVFGEAWRSLEAWPQAGAQAPSQKVPRPCQISIKIWDITPLKFVTVDVSSEGRAGTFGLDLHVTNSVILVPSTSRYTSSALEKWHRSKFRSLTETLNFLLRQSHTRAPKPV